MKKKKGSGIIWAVLGVGLLMIVLAVAFVAATMFGKQHLERRYLVEVTLISESDKVETYVRSYQKATLLSLIQAIYDTGKGQVILESDFDSIYDKRYNMSYWQIHDSKFAPTYEEIGNSTSRVANAYMIDYLEKYRDFSMSTFPMGFSDPSELRTNTSILGEGNVSMQAYPITFSRTTVVEDQEINIDRVFIPYAEVKTKLKIILDNATDIVENDELGKCVKGSTEDLAKQCLKNLASEYEQEDIKVELKLMPNSFKDDGEKQSGLINVSIYENVTNHTLYGYLDDSIDIRTFGVFFLAKVGNLIEYDPNQVVVTELTNFHDCSDYCASHDCGSNLESHLGVISKKSEDEICPFLRGPGVPKGCLDDDSGIKPEIAGTTTDYSEEPPVSEDDTCLDAFTLREYYCLAPPGAGIAHIDINCEEYCIQEYGPEYSGICVPDNRDFCLCYPIL